MALTKYKLGSLIIQCIGGNEKLTFSESSVKGISINKNFMQTKADLDGVSLSNYTVVEPKCFSFVTVTSRNGGKISIAYNDSDEAFIVSSFYVTFKLNEFGKTVLLEDYLYMFFNRGEFDRYARRDSWGSAREYFYFENICDVEITLPDIPTQQKYVDIYKAMVANQQSYERGLEDLKLVCDGYIEDLRRKMPSEKIGPYIEKVDNRNMEKLLDVYDVKSVNMNGTFAETVANVDVDRIHTYKIVKPNDFAYTNRINIGSIARRLPEDGACLVSASYDVFRIINTEKIIPEYLTLWIRREEFFRSTGFYSVGSVKDNFSVDMMKLLEIPIPDIDVQKSITSIYSVYIVRKKINEQLKAQIKDICPILIRGSLEEGKAQ